MVDQYNLIFVFRFFECGVLIKKLTECFIANLSSHPFKGSLLGMDMNNGIDIVQGILCHPQDFLDIGGELNLLKVCIDKMVNLCHLV